MTILSFVKQGEWGCLERLKKKSHFFSDSGFFGVTDKNLVRKQVGGVYVNDEVLGTGHCSNCGGTPVQLAIAAITTQDNINTQIGATQGFPEKRKFSDI